MYSCTALHCAALHRTVPRLAVDYKKSLSRAAEQEQEALVRRYCTIVLVEQEA